MKDQFLLLIIMLCIHTSLTYGHGDEKHEEDSKQKANLIHESLEGEIKEKYNEGAYKKINSAYQKNIKPIFENSCFNCHSQEVNYPWYYKLPIVKSIIDEDIEEARTHLVFGEGFPFKGHGEPIKDLKAIGRATREREMPPLEYIIMHPYSYLNEKEQKVIDKWVEKSLELLE